MLCAGSVLGHGGGGWVCKAPAWVCKLLFYKKKKKKGRGIGIDNRAQKDNRAQAVEWASGC